MDELTRMRASVPEAPPGRRAQTVLQEAIRAERAIPAGPEVTVRRQAGARRYGRLRPSLAVLAGSLSLAAAVLAGVLITGPGPAPSVPAAPGLTVAGLASRSAAAAEAGPQVRPGQWGYFAGQFPDGRPSGPFQVWKTASASRAAWLLHGKVRFINGPITGLPMPIGDVVGWSNARHLIRYGELGSLPRDPRALERYLASVPQLGHETVPQKTFDLAGNLLSTYLLPPPFEAALLRAVGFIPGIRVYSHFIDALGRPGVGFLMPMGPVNRLAIVLDPHTFRFRSYEAAKQHPRQTIRLTGPVVLRERLVPGPGVIPPSARHH
jgi:hypothetical protein